VYGAQPERLQPAGPKPGDNVRVIKALRLSPGAVLLLAAIPASAACPTGLTLEVDNDVPGSGYSEVKPENWVTHSVDSCKGNYRYLSAYVGDGTRKGKAIWRPNITVAGVYEVTTSYRATTNRTNDADYVLYDDQGGAKPKSVNQQSGSGCTKNVIGTAYCAVGGSCRLVLDGDDGKSDSADVTTFVLVSCDEPGDAGAGSACTGIAAVSAFEVCEESSTTCAGVFTNGVGCDAYCAAAGMICTARFGGEPNCQKEALSPIDCGASNGHASDWCECAFAAGAGGTSATGGAGGSTVGGAGGVGATGGDAGTGGGWSGGAGIGTPAGGSGGSSSAQPGVTEADGGCGCRSVGTRSQAGAAWLALALLLVRRRPSRWGRQRHD